MPPVLRLGRPCRCDGGGELRLALLPGDRAFAAPTAVPAGLRRVLLARTFCKPAAVCLLTLFESVIPTGDAKSLSTHDSSPKIAAASRSPVIAGREMSLSAWHWGIVAGVFAVLVAVAAVWLAIDRRPPQWDHANHLERVVTCAEDLARGDIKRILERSSFYPPFVPRSEERRVGKECRSRWSPDH